MLGYYNALYVVKSTSYVSVSFVNWVVVPQGNAIPPDVTYPCYTL